MSFRRRRRTHTKLASMTKTKDLRALEGGDWKGVAGAAHTMLQATREAFRKAQSEEPQHGPVRIIVKDGVPVK